MRYFELFEEEYNDLIGSVKWLFQYIENSFIMDSKVKTNNFVIKKILPPLYKIIPQPKDKISGLYRIMDANATRPAIGTKVEVKPRDWITSWTDFSDMSHWERLADEIGADNNGYVIKADYPLTVLITPHFLYRLKEVLFKSTDNEIKSYINQIDPSWQNEYLLNGSIGVRATVVAHLKW